jgi:hypothetical protein
MSVEACRRPFGLEPSGSFVDSNADLRRVHAALILCVLIAGCAPSRASREPTPEVMPAEVRLDVLRRRIDALAAPWPDASSALSLMRDSGEARALTPREVRAISDGVGERWEVEYGLDPSAVRTEADQADAAILRVIEGGYRENASAAGGGSTAAHGFVVRRFRIDGLASGRTVVVDVPLREATGAGRFDGERWQAFVNGAPVDAPLGASHVAIELARDEATAIRVGRKAP